MSLQSNKYVVSYGIFPMQREPEQQQIHVVLIERGSFSHFIISETMEFVIVVGHGEVLQTAIIYACV